MQVRQISWGMLVGCLALIGGGCGDDDGPTVAPTTFTLAIENVSESYDFTDSGAFAVPTGAAEAGPIGPGGAYEVAFDAAPGDRLSFALMFVPSNDLFFGPDDQGIELFDGSGDPLEGDITAQIDVWDAGSEVNEELGAGANQVQRQSGPNTGPADANANVRLAAADNLPAVADTLLATLESTSASGFLLRIENVSTGDTLQTSDGGSQAVPFSPGVFVVHRDPAPIFTLGAPDRGEGLEAIAEDGDVSALADALARRTGVNAVLSPGVAVVHRGDGPIFTLGEADRGQGLEAIAEDGDPSTLASALSGQAGIGEVVVFNTPAGASAPGPIPAGGSYRTTLTATPRDRLSFATMYVQSNDLFLGPDDLGIDLFDAAGNPLAGDITAQILLWDAGSEENQTPGAGPDQAPRQSGPNTGAADPDTAVRLAIDSSGRIPNPDEYIRITLQPSP